MQLPLAFIGAWGAGRLGETGGKREFKEGKGLSVSAEKPRTQASAALGRQGGEGEIHRGGTLPSGKRLSFTRGAALLGLSLKNLL